MEGHCCGIEGSHDDGVHAITIQNNLNSSFQPGPGLHVDGNNLGPSDITVIGSLNGVSFS